MLVTVSGCGSSLPTTPSAPTTETSTFAPADTTPSVAKLVTIPSPSADETTALLSGLAAIDPSLADSKAVSRARNVCQQSAPGNFSDASGLSTYVQQEFADGDTPTVSSATAAAIIALVTSSTWCTSS